MNIKYKIETIPLDDKYPGRVEELNNEGWRTIQGTTPVAIFHLFRDEDAPRPEQVSGLGAQGVLTIDDSKVQVVRNGKVVG